MLAIPKRRRVPVQRSESVAGVLEQHRERHETTQTTRVELAIAAPVAELTRAGLQALLDKAMSSYLPNHPRVLVTDKPFSVMRRRLELAAVRDLKGFIDWTIGSWTTLAHQNRAALIKDVSKLKRGAPLPESPAFAALAYRLPYFIAAYSNHLSSGRTGKVDTMSPEQRKIAQLQAQVQRLEGEKEILRRTKRITTDVTTNEKVKRRTPQTDTIFDDDWTPPQWVENSGKERTKRKA